MTIFTKLSSLVLITSFFGSITNAYAACSVPNGGDALITVDVTQNMHLGKVVTPDSGQSDAVSLTANGTRSVPSNLQINSSNSTNHGDPYQVALINIGGSPECQFQITIENISSADLSNITLQGVEGTSLNSSSSGATGLLSAAGSAKVQIGALLEISSSDVNDISESFNVKVDFVPQ